MSKAYYNEIDPFAAQWLRNLIEAGQIAKGDVDERSIIDVQPGDLAGYTQCHFFAGIGVWSHALRQAGWDDNRPVWTGSCPCQPFSAAGKGQGKEDKRHLWPEFYRLIRECRPSTVFGEQVAAAIGHAWLDSLQSDMEREEYAVGKAVLGAGSVGAPHIRQRLYFVADTAVLRCEQQRSTEAAALQGERAQREGEHEESGHAGQLSWGLEGLRRDGIVADSEYGGRQLVADVRGSDAAGVEQGGTRLESGDAHAGSGFVAETEHSERRSEHQEHGYAYGRDGLGRSSDPEFLADSDQSERGRWADSELLPDREASGRNESDGQSEPDQQTDDSPAGVALGDTYHSGLEGREVHGECSGELHAGTAGMADGLEPHPERPGPTNGFWRTADWLRCTDGKWRSVEPGTQPLAHGSPARVGRLRGYGNAICSQTAKEFIAAYLEVTR